MRERARPRQRSHASEMHKRAHHGRAAGDGLKAMNRILQCMKWAVRGAVTKRWQQVQAKPISNVSTCRRLTLAATHAAILSKIGTSLLLLPSRCGGGDSGPVLRQTAGVLCCSRCRGFMLWTRGQTVERADCSRPNSAAGLPVGHRLVAHRSMLPDCSCHCPTILGAKGSTVGLQRARVAARCSDWKQTAFRCVRDGQAYNAVLL